MQPATSVEDDQEAEEDPLEVVELGDEEQGEAGTSGTQ